MTDQVTPHRVFERRSRLPKVLASDHDTNAVECETVEECGEQAEEQAEGLIPFVSQSISTGTLLALQLETICETGEQHFKGLVFALGHTKEGNTTLTVTQRELHCHPPFGNISRVHIVFIENDYTVNLLGTKFMSGTVYTETDVYNLCEIFSDQSSLSPYKFCPGIDWDQYEDKYHSVIRFHVKSVRQSTSPFKRIDSVNCKRWFKLPSNAPFSDKFSKEVLCSSCKRLKSDLEWQKKRTQSESPTKKEQRQDPSSKAKLSYMSPSSQMKRKRNALMERNSDKKKLAKYQNTEVTLSEEQHEEMSSVVSRIEEVGKDELEKVFAEGDAHGVGAQIREIWTTDRREQLDQFRQDQARNSMFMHFKLFK